jgi:hypothetical protein
MEMWFGDPDGKSSPLRHRIPQFNKSMIANQESIFSNPADRRGMRRFSMKLPASVRISGIPSEFRTETENVSARGVFFYVERWMSEGSRVEVTMNFPPQVTLADSLQVRCIARVVRVEPQSSTRSGVAAAIEEYEFVRPEDDARGSAELQPGWNTSG